MALSIGKTDATTGLTKALYDAMDAELRPPLEKLLRDANRPEAEIASAVAKAQVNWKQLSHTLASGLVPALRQETESAAPPPEPAVAETYSSAAQDPLFWAWLAEFASVFQAWSKGTATPAALTAFFNREVPKELKGVIR
jgi:hypothetical protein